MISGVEGLPAFEDEVQLPKNSMLDPSCSLLHRPLLISYVFFGFLGISCISSIFMISGGGNLPAFKDEVQSLLKPLLDPIWLLFHGFSRFQVFS